MKRKLWIGITAGVALLMGGAWAVLTYLDIRVFGPLEDAEKYELVSLEPYRPVSNDSYEALKKGMQEAPGSFVGVHKVLGRLEIKDAATQRKLNDALRKGVRESDGEAAACFWPRHAIVVSRGRATTQYVICFKCSAIEIVAGNKLQHLTVTKSPEPVFDKVLTDAGIPLAPKD